MACCFTYPLSVITRKPPYILDEEEWDDWGLTIIGDFDVVPYAVSRRQVGVFLCTIDVTLEDENVIPRGVAHLTIWRETIRKHW